MIKRSELDNLRPLVNLFELARLVYNEGTPEFDKFYYLLASGKREFSITESEYIDQALKSKNLQIIRPKRDRARKTPWTVLKAREKNGNQAKSGGGLQDKAPSGSNDR